MWRFEYETRPQPHTSPFAPRQRRVAIDVALLRQTCEHEPADNWRKSHDQIVISAAAMNIQCV
ncbi:MAG: hypothetical protein M0D54_13615 [Hyphomonadaceae bacterium JAD_PAG50586_4]|nr:MAG: hypothetical protein M0D54_13615 [Hyphomonadaceae bacterium JAD_PAG50586_4]